MLDLHRNCTSLECKISVRSLLPLVKGRTHTAVSVDEARSLICVPDHIRIQTQDTTGSGAISVGNLALTEQIRYGRGQY